MMDDSHVFTGRRAWPRCFDRTCILGCYQVVVREALLLQLEARSVQSEVKRWLVSPSAGGQLSLRSTKRAIDYDFCNQGSVGTAFSSDLATSTNRMREEEEPER